MYRNGESLLACSRARANENNALELTKAYRDCVRATARVCVCVCLCVYLCKGSRRTFQWQTRCNMYCAIWCRQAQQLTELKESRKPFPHMNFLYAFGFPRDFCFLNYEFCFVFFNCVYISRWPATQPNRNNGTHSYLNYLVECNSFVCFVVIR